MLHDDRSKFMSLPWGGGGIWQNIACMCLFGELLLTHTHGLGRNIQQCVDGE